MFGLSTKPRHQDGGVCITIRLNARLQPADRGNIYEDPLDAMLKAERLGEVTGGATKLAEDGSVAYCDLEVRVPDTKDATLAKITDVLELLGAPKLIAEGQDKVVTFGRLEGLAVYLNGVDLHAGIYQSCDINQVIAEFDRLMGIAGRYQGFWQGPRETALYLYGKNAEKMRSRIEPFIVKYPLCQRARVEKIA